MWRRKLLKALGLAVYGGALLVAFGVASYLAFSLFVRSGVTRTPDLVGLPQDEALALLAEQALRWDREEVESRYSETIPAGQVAAQRPRAGSLVKQGSGVKLVLSLGPQRLSVPELSGKGLPAAQVALTASGLTLGRTLGIFRPGAEPGTVVGQMPEPEESAAPATPVDLFLAQAGSAEAYLMPDLVYRRYEEVRRFFEQRGFRLGSVRFEPYEGAPEGAILRQFPLAGHPLSRRDAISLVVAAAAETAGT